MRKKSTTPILIFLFGMIFLACGGLSSYFFAQVTDLNCTRVETAQFRCEKVTRWMGRILFNRESISDLTGADVEESCDGDGCTYRVVLLTTDNAAVPLTDFYTSGEAEKQELAAQINAFVDDRERNSLNIKGDAGLLGILLPLVFAGIGALIALIGIFTALNSQFRPSTRY